MSTWQVLNSPIVIAGLVSLALTLLSLAISNKYNNRRDLRAIQASVMNRFSEAISSHLLNIEMPSKATHVEDFRRSSSELRAASNMTLAMFPSKKVLTCFTEQLMILDDFCNEVIQNSGEIARDLSKDRKYVKAQMIAGLLLREMCGQLDFPLKRFKYKFSELYDAKQFPLQVELLEEFRKSGWITG